MSLRSRSRASVMALASRAGTSRSISRSRRPRSPIRRRRPVPPELRATIEAAMAKYPDRHSAAIPALHAAQEMHGWCSPEAIDQVAAVMQVTPAYLTSRGHVLRHVLDRSRSRATTCSCARTSPARCAAPTSSTRRCSPRPRTTSDVNVRSFECLGACDIAPMASVDGEYVGPLDIDDAGRIVEDLRRGPRRPEGEAAALPQVRGPGSGGVSKTILFDRIDEPGLNTLEVYERRGGYQSLRKALGSSPRGGARTRSTSPGSAAAAAPASRWARRSRSCPTARWPSTSCATRTSPSPARSRTAS